MAVETRDYRVEFAGDRAWTIFRILHRGTLIGDRNGFYGTVLVPEGGKWIGTGHTEGGLEQVESAVLTIDGQPVDLKDQAVYRGSRAELRKTSALGPLRLEAAYAVLDDCILERHRYQAPQDTKLHLLYGFMHCWLPCTTAWTAEKSDGSRVSGSFDSKGDFELRADVKWTALFDPLSRKAALAWFPTVLAGQGHRTAYWDKTNYHKLYTQLFSGASLPQGTQLDARLVVQVLDCTADNWQQAAQDAAARLQQRLHRGEIPF